MNFIKIELMTEKEYILDEVQKILNNIHSINVVDRPDGLSDPSRGRGSILFYSDFWPPMNSGDQYQYFAVRACSLGTACGQRDRESIKYIYGSGAGYPILKQFPNHYQQTLEWEPKAKVWEALGEVLKIN
ncbi:hypothetical protein [Microcoleus sp. Pol12B5]|uniref:hypothetical protein n=1 Tax=Microcoleus sp. Pol12B5 TaxID=3055396 RepID=UPI002FCFB194